MDWNLLKNVDEGRMRKCIFCNCSEDDFGDDNCWTEEHIIPKALGNNSLKLFNVCKNCNSKLGANVDNYFVNHRLVKIIRQRLKLPGQSGEIPNAFEEGKDEKGNIIRIDKNYHPTVVPTLKTEGNKVRVVAGTKEEAKAMLQKKLSRMKMPEEVIQEKMSKIDEMKSQCYQPKVSYDITVELNRFFMEALKIAYEYAIYKIGDDYLEDSRAMEIQQYLKMAKDGEMKNKCDEFYGVSFLPKEIKAILQNVSDLNIHMLMLHPDRDKKLIAEIILFMEPMLSFSVLVSQNSNKYSNLKYPLTEIIQIQAKSD